MWWHNRVRSSSTVCRSCGGRGGPLRRQVRRHMPSRVQVRAAQMGLGQVWLLLLLLLLLQFESLVFDPVLLFNGAVQLGKEVSVARRGLGLKQTMNHITFLSHSLKEILPLVLCLLLYYSLQMSLMC